MAHAIRHGDGKHRAILVATSGDTGGAALSGLRMFRTPRALCFSQGWSFRTSRSANAGSERKQCSFSWH